MENRKITGIIFGAISGALAMYLFDPHRGTARRAKLRDKAVSLIHQARNRSRKFSTNLSKRTVGKVDAYVNRRKAPAVNDYTLQQRVRSAFGRVTSHPKAIRVFVSEGDVFLSGPILRHEVERLLECVRRVPGVKSVRDELSKYHSPDRISSLQGEGPEYLS